MCVVRGLTAIWGFVDSRAADLLERESDPRQTVEMLDWWERAWGLPDPCLAIPQSVAERQIVLVNKMTMLGAQSRAFFMSFATAIGYTITIQEYAPFMVGVSRVGDTTYQNTLTGGDNLHMRWQLGAPEMRFYWTIAIGGVSLTWFRVTKGQAGVDPHLRIGVPEDLECIIHRYQPAHTQVIFDFSGIGGISDPMQGTP
jgi:uncharacterized protein YmfQ (DUF2313 family)